ncbi:expressed unknown protein [Seminavis robusta]|uniref:Uncharacterized protein n=1 Tax=Seminavis robusta TaxID=568900 RepID=A0A9N8EV01_9STRA|nr:expressed unknown protein [Seminavis robusta]|eukprot:Sro1765_g296160.1 n/a (527) ;mRNA; f:7875-9455
MGFHGKATHHDKHHRSRRRHQSKNRTGWFAWTVVFGYAFTLIFVVQDLSHLNRFHKTIKAMGTVDNRDGRKLHEQQSDTLGPERNQHIHCASWEDASRMDEWWQDHPDWEPSPKHETDDEACFVPIENPEKAAFFRHLRDYLASTVNCSLEASMMDSAGDDDTMIVSKEEESELESIIQDAVEEIWKSRNDRESTGPMQSAFNTANCSSGKTSYDAWACSFLPLTKCNEHIKTESIVPAPMRGAGDEAWLPSSSGAHQNGSDTIQQQQQRKSWLYSYLMRPKQAVRQKLRRTMLPTQIPNPDACIAFFMPSTTEAQNSRDIIRHYLESADGIFMHDTENATTTGASTAILLSDDTKLLSGAQVLSSNHHWILLSNSGDISPTTLAVNGKTSNATASSDDDNDDDDDTNSNGAMDNLLRVVARWNLAGQCKAAVHSSKDAPRKAFLSHAMMAQHGVGNYTLYQVETNLLEEDGKIAPHGTDVPVPTMTTWETVAGYIWEEARTLAVWARKAAKVMMMGCEPLLCSGA